MRSVKTSRNFRFLKDPVSTPEHLPTLSDGMPREGESRPGDADKTGGALCGPVRVKVGVKDNQTTNTQVTAIMRDVGLRNYGEFNEPFFCNKAVLWAVDKNGWALLACRSV